MFFISVAILIFRVWLWPLSAIFFALGVYCVVKSVTQTSAR